MSDARGVGLNAKEGEGSRSPLPQEPRPRAVGSPLPVGFRSPAGSLGAPSHASAAPPPGRALANGVTPPPLEIPSGMQRAVSLVRAAMPIAQKLLPLLEGNILTAFSNMLAPRPHPAPPPAPPVNLAPIEDGLAQLQTDHRQLRDQVVEQNSSLKRVEDQLEMVREATDRNTLEQQELMEDLKGVGKKVNLVALAALGLLAVSVAINVVLYLHIVRVLP